MSTTYYMHLTGTAPMLMHSDKASDPLSNDAQFLSEISKKKNKSEEDLEELARREFLVSLYRKGGEIYYPIDNLHSCIHIGAKQRKEGGLFRGSFVVTKSEFIYDGPKDPEKLYEVRDDSGDRKFVDRRSVVVRNARIFRTRPIFPEWEIYAEALGSGDSFDIFHVGEWLDLAGQKAGLGDYRPGKGGLFGTFTAVVDIEPIARETKSVKKTKK